MKKSRCWGSWVLERWKWVDSHRALDGKKRWETEKQKHHSCIFFPHEYVTLESHMERKQVCRSICTMELQYVECMFNRILICEWFHLLWNQIQEYPRYLALTFYIGPYLFESSVPRCVYLKGACSSVYITSNSLQKVRGNDEEQPFSSGYKLRIYVSN